MTTLCFRRWAGVTPRRAVVCLLAACGGAAACVWFFCVRAEPAAAPTVVAQRAPWKHGRMPGSERLSLERKLQLFANGGVTLAPGMSVSDLLRSFPRDQYESDWQLLAISLGAELEDGSGRHLSDQLWHFDAECIEDRGAYVAIAARFATLAGGALPLQEISDEVDIEAGRARLSFRLDGARHEWDAEVNEDWADPSILSRFARLLRQRSAAAGKRFTYLDLGGQDCLIGCATPTQLDALRRASHLDWVWLE